MSDRTMRQGGERAFLGHPRGLAVLFGTEGFSAYGLYGVQSILVLALSASILTPGTANRVVGLAWIEHWLGLGQGATAQSGAALIVGLFGALVFSAPMVGGLIADNLLGHARSVMIGLFVFFCGMALLTMHPLFLLGLLLMVVGLGLASTTKAQVGALYGADDPRRSNGFQLYSMAVQIAVILAPLVCGALAQLYGWSWGFAAASMGGLLAFIVYVAFHRVLAPGGAGRKPAADAVGDPTVRRRSGSFGESVFALGRSEVLVLLGLALLLPVLALASVGNMEIFDGYLLWAKQHYDLRWFGYEMPVSWLMSFDALVSVGTTVISIALWTWFERRGRPVSDMMKIALGTTLCAVATTVLALAPTGRVGLGWAVAFHVLNDLGNTNTYMVSMALYSRLAPASLRATVTNACALQIFLANLMVSQLASRLGTLGPVRFWLLHSLLIGLAAVVLFALIAARGVLRSRGRRYGQAPVLPAPG